jgi:cysteine-S-conjugate beta-lyase
MNAQHGPFDFDHPADRRGTDARKWGDVQARWGHPDVLPMPMADMDFAVAPVIQQAMARRLEHGIFGYTRVSDVYREAVCGWMRRRHGWVVQPDHVLPAPGVVPAAYAAIRAVCPEGGAVVVQPPLYPRLLRLEPLGVRPVSCPLALEAGRYHLDLAALEAQLDRAPARAMVLCNPHNPVGRAWGRAELEALGQLCLRRDLWVVADEVFGDLCVPGQRFTPFASLGLEIAARTVTCTSASKAFNLAGLSTAAAVVPDAELRSRVQAALASTGFTTPGPFGLAASAAAYTQGEPWLEALLPYLAANLAELEAWLVRMLPRARLLPMEAGYLAWIDLRAYGLDSDTLYSLALERSRVALVRGTHFGPAGEGFLRMNLGCPRATLRDALARLERGFVPALGARP